MGRHTRGSVVPHRGLFLDLVFSLVTNEAVSAKATSEVTRATGGTPG